VAQDGTVTSASVLKGHRLFHDAAMNAVQTWRFAPRETPTQQPAIVTIDFEVIHDMVLP
jgi:TonB family protein